MSYNGIGIVLSWTGVILSIIGTIVNSVMLDHNLAILIWFISNPILMVWAWGAYKGKWAGGLGYVALCVLYAIYVVTGAYAIAAINGAPI